MRADILVVGQGLAGTLLGCELERAGLSFAIADDPDRPSASAVAAGIINPITGRRLVKSWRIDSLRPIAREMYRGIETMLEVPLWHDMRVHRRFADEQERSVFAKKFATGELAPFIESPGDDDGFWISGAARVDMASLLEAVRARWLRQEKFLLGAIDPIVELARFDRVIDCRGFEAAARDGAWSFVPWEFSKGELLELNVSGLAPDVILNRREWIVPTSATAALVGATHEPGARDRAPTVAAREKLEDAAHWLLGGAAFAVTARRAGVRVNLTDKRPIAGVHPAHPRLGLINGLGAKGALWAPFLAREWLSHLLQGTPFNPEIDVGRFAH